MTITEYRDIVSQTMVKVDCYNILKAIWQAKLPGINDVDLQIYAQNDAGIVGVVGDCSVSHSLNWESLDYRSAWYQYDTAFVFPTLPQ